MLRTLGFVLSSGTGEGAEASYDKLTGAVASGCGGKGETGLLRTLPRGQRASVLGIACTKDRRSGATGCLAAQGRTIFAFLFAASSEIVFIRPVVSPSSGPTCTVVSGPCDQKPARPPASILSPARPIGLSARTCSGAVAAQSWPRDPCVFVLAYESTGGTVLAELGGSWNTESVDDI